MQFATLGQAEVVQLQPKPIWRQAVSTANWLFCLLLSFFVVRAAGDPVSGGQSQHKFVPAPSFDCNPGPWGDLEYVRITLEPPDHFAEESLSLVKTTQWFFRMSREQVTQYFESLGLEPTELDSLLHKSLWQDATNGVWVLPPERTVIRLDTGARTKLYSLLTSFSENTMHQTPFIFRRETLDERFARSSLSSNTVSLVRSMMYSKGPLLAFSDLPAVMSQIHNKEEKIHLIKVLSRKATLMLRLKLTPETDVSRLVSYWGTGGRSKDLRPLLESLTRIDGGWEADIAHLLPAFARQRLYTYPAPSKLQNVPHDNCHWTSFNFFNDVPDDGPKDPRKLQKIIDDEYDVVNGPKHLGDVVLVIDSSGAILHSAVFIADDIVFTKTGGRENQPWILMKMEDMLPLYASANQPLKTVLCRKKMLQ